MSDQNETEGRVLYFGGDMETRDWFERQWAAWPKRVDEANTTNISFLYGGVTAYRAENLANPEMSADFRTHVDWLDRHATHPASNFRQDEGTVV
ncbi:hypothetical protein [Sphingomonas albertensis]|uniref:hypothetical protein n=1 Tax=Sphingomonas albertensis TaxID=2762591 RepID=UPI0037D9DE63